MSSHGLEEPQREASLRSFGVRGGGSEITMHVSSTPIAPGDEPQYRWRAARLTAVLGRFRGELFDQHLLVEDLQQFEQEVSALYDTLRGTAEFVAIEGWLTIKFEGDGSGRIEVTGTLVDDSVGYEGNRIEFLIPDYDQTYLPDLLSDLRTTIAGVL